MKRGTFWSVVACVSLLVLSGATVGVVSYSAAGKLIHPARWNPATTPADVGLPYERVSFSTDDGIDLVAWWMPADAARGIVIVLHGYGDSKNQSLAVAPFLHDAGYSVLAPDMRAHGESGGDHTTVGLDEVADVQAALRYVQERQPEAPEKLAFLGFSMGAATALNAAPTYKIVDAVIADSAFATLTNIASNSITHFTDLPKYPFGPLSVRIASVMVKQDIADNAPIASAARGSAPILVIQGLDDTIAFPHDDGEAIASVAPGGSELWLVPGATHVQAHAIAPAEYEARVLAFLEKHLSG